MMRMPLSTSLVLDDADPRLVFVLRGAQDEVRVTAAHRHAHGQLFGADTGLVTVGARHGQWVVPATHAVWVPPHEEHSMRSHGPFSGWSLYICESACAALPAALRTIKTSALLRAAVDRASSWADAPLDDAQTRLATVMLDEIAATDDEGLGLPMPRDARLLRVARQLATTPGDQRSLDEWAVVAAVSSRTLSRRFVEETGFTFSQWRQRARLMRAVELLAAEHAVTAIALDLGYEDVSAFIAAFRRMFGVTPARFAAAGFQVR